MADDVTPEQVSGLVTAAALADALGVTQATINNWRRAGVIPVAGRDTATGANMYDLVACRIAAGERAIRGGGRRPGAGRPRGTMEIDPVDGAPLRIVDGEIAGRLDVTPLGAAAQQAGDDALFGGDKAGRRWKVDVTSPAAIAEMGRDGVTAAEAKTAKDLLDAYRMRLDLDERAGRLIDAAEARAMYLEITGTITQALDMLPGRLAREVALIAGLEATQIQALREALAAQIDAVRGVVRDAVAGSGEIPGESGTHG